MSRKYCRVQSGEWVFPKRRGYRMMCCDCGLVHVLNYKIVKGKIFFQAFRDNRATGQARRRYKGKK